MSKAVFCMARNLIQAEAIVDLLKNEGVSCSDVSILVPERFGTKDFAHDHHNKTPEGDATGAGGGGVVGGAMEWLAGIGTLAIPGAGTFIAAGSIMDRLSGSGGGAAVGGLGGALVGMGLTENEAKRYEGKIRGGNILISVHSDDANETEHAKEVFRRCNAEGIASSGEASVSKSKASSLAGV